VSTTLESAQCGSYELFAPEGEVLREAVDGSLIVFAEVSYLVKLSEGASPETLKPALRIPRHGSEGTLRFDNFVGRSSLGGRMLEVRSKRIDRGAATAMLDEVSGWFASLPFGSNAPVETTYATRYEDTPEILYHAFAIIRDAYRGLGRRDLRGALERILAVPHESLRLDQPRLVALGSASRVDADTLAAIPQLGEHLRPVPPESRLASSPAAVALRGTLPDSVQVQPFAQSSHNPENRFVAHVLDSMIDLLRRFLRWVRAQQEVSEKTNFREAREIADFLARCRRHRVLAEVRADPRLPAHSTALRRKPGYREILALHSTLLERLGSAEPDDVQGLLESRSAADIYEYWCFVRVVRALEGILGAPLSTDRLETTAWQSSLRRGYQVTWPGLTATYNDTFAPANTATFKTGEHSYSLTLRPDIVLRQEGRIDVFDAKLKVNFVLAATADDEDESWASDHFKPADLHKMHAYRDALGCRGVWVLYPGKGQERAFFEAPAEADGGTELSGVGAIALRPGVSHDGGLSEVLEDLVRSTAEA
jgi:predicted component of viral defense system (DUF524 family)